MRCRFIGLTFLCLLHLSVSLSAQIIPGERREDAIRRREEAGRREEADFRRRMNDLQTLERRSRALSRKTLEIAEPPRLSGEDRERIQRLRHIDAADLQKYDLFLRQKGTGVFKLFPDLGCVSRNVIRISGDCERFVPMSSSFNFRTSSYGDETYHDIHFEGEKISSKSFFSQGILAAIGDEPIENIQLSHNAIKYLSSFEPDVDPVGAADHANQFKAGIASGGYSYADNVTPQENTTYVLRTIAYRLDKIFSPVNENTTMNEMMFRSLAFDKRQDVIVAFKVLRRDDLGGLTIVWKELDRKDAAKIKYSKKQSLRDFRTDTDR